MSTESESTTAAAHGFAGLTPEKARIVDEICDCFEHQIYTRNGPSIESLLAGFAEPERSVLLRELLLLELERCLSGDARPNLERYLHRFPDHASLVQEVFAQVFPAPIRATQAARAAVPVIPNYRILRELSQGGMGAVYEAMHTELGNLVAIKVLKPNLVSDLEAEVRFKREMKVIGTLTHSHIVQARDAGKAGSIHYLVMEYLVGFDLAQLVQRVGPLPVPDACEIARRTALALAHAHQHKLVHRDIKPKNVLFGRSYGAAEPVQVKVADFGLALLRGYPRPQASTSEGIVGTFGFMAPEQYWEQRSDIRSDIYSLGCTLHFLLLSRPPFSRSQYPETEQLMDAHRRAPVPSLQVLRPDVSPTLEHLLQTMLAKDPRDRPQTPLEVGQQLEQFCAGYDFDRLLGEAETIEGESQPSANSVAGKPAMEVASQTQPWIRSLPSGRVDEAALMPTDRTGLTTAPLQRPKHPAPSAARARTNRTVPWLVLAGLVLLALCIAPFMMPNREPESLNLLKLVDPAKQAISGDWQMKNGVLFSPDEKQAMLALPHTPPAAYKLEIEARRQSGGRIVIGLLRQGQQIPIVLNFAKLAAGSADDEASRAQTEQLAAKLGFQGGRPDTYTAIVRPEGMVVAFEDQVQIALNPGELPQPPADQWRTPGRDTLFLGTDYSVYHIHSITLTSISP